MDQSNTSGGTPLPPPLPGRAPVRRRPASDGKGWMIVAIVSLCLLGFMLLVSMVKSLVGGGQTGRQSGTLFEEVLVEYNKSGNKIAIIDVAGIITGQAFDGTGRSMVDFIEDQLNESLEDDAVKAVVLKIDSPGGEVMASDDIARALVEFQSDSGKPVVAAMGGMAASGGYYVAAPCRWIVANELTITGSIGVIMQSFNYSGFLDKVGVFPQVFKSGRFKDMLRGSKTPEEIDPEATEMIQAMVNETFVRFKEVVAEGRARAATLNKGAGKALDDQWQEYADGRILTGQKAYDLGFVDELGTFSVAIERAKQLAGIEDANLIRYQEPFNLAQMLGLFMKAKLSTRQEPVRIQLDGQGVMLEPGRPYFLSPTVIF